VISWARLSRFVKVAFVVAVVAILSLALHSKPGFNAGETFTILICLFLLAWFASSIYRDIRAKVDPAFRERKEAQEKQHREQREADEYTRNFGKRDEATSRLTEKGFVAEVIVPLQDRKTFFAISRETPGVAVCTRDGQTEIIALDLIIDATVSNVVETTWKSKGGMTGFEVGGVFLGSGGTNTTISDKVTQSWLCLRVRDFDRPERWFCFASPEEARTQMNRIELLLEPRGSASQGI